MSDKKDPFKIEDPSVLTFIEHRLIGSGTNREDMMRNPFKPQAVLDGKRPMDVAEKRVRQREIVCMDYEAFGLSLGKNPVVALNIISNKTGEVIDPALRLTAIYDEGISDFIRDPVELSKYKLTPEGREKYMVEGQISVREKAG